MRHLILALHKVVLVIVTISNCQSQPLQLAPLDAAVLRGDWNAVVDQLRRDDSRSLDPVARLLAAHACLATDNNNESMMLFSSVDAEDGVARWVSYTEALAQAHSENHIAQYLLGDAYARSQRYREAIVALGRSLTLKPRFELALVARGVASVAAGDPDSGLADLISATESDAAHADAWAALGILWLRMQVPDAALQALDQSLIRNREFALALLARGVALHAQGRLQESAVETARSGLLLPYLKATAADHLEMLERSAERRRGTQAAESAPGAPMRSSVVALSADEPARTVVVREPFSWRGPSADTHLFGASLPRLGQYYRPPERTQIANPDSSRLVYDRVVQYFDYSRVEKDINNVIGLVGVFSGAAAEARRIPIQVPETRGPMEEARLQEAHSPFSNALRLLVKDDGTFALLRYRDKARTSDPLAMANWEVLPQDEAINRLNRNLSYTQQVASQTDASEQNLFRAVSGLKWQEHFATADDLAGIMKLPPQTPLTVTVNSSLFRDGTRISTNVASFLHGEIGSTRNAQTLPSQTAPKPLSTAPNTWHGWVSRSPAESLSPGQISGPGILMSTTGPGKRGGRGGGITRPPSWNPPPIRRPPPPNQPKPGGAPAPGDRPSAPGGVSTREIGDAWVDVGDWNVAMVFSLLYR